MPDRATLVALADDSWTVFVNGTQVLSGKDVKSASHANLKPHLKVGENLIAVQAANSAPKPADKDKKSEDPSSPAGLIDFARLETGANAVDLFTDRTWTCTTNNPADWRKPDFGASSWIPAIELGSAADSPWREGPAALTRALSLELAHDHIRASLVPADPLTTALGRPNREQVMTSRASVATTLQALELSNGETLAKLFKAGASKWMADRKPTPTEVSQEAFQRGLGRSPSDKEQQVAKELLGQQVSPEQVEDLLWAIAMLPEFQLIY